MKTLKYGHQKLKKELYEACRTIIEHEDAFIDLAFEMGPMEGLTAKDVKDYIRFIANRRLDQLGLEAIYDVEKNPLGWLDTMLNAVEHMNFLKVVQLNILKHLPKEHGSKHLVNSLEIISDLIQELFYACYLCSLLKV